MFNNKNISINTPNFIINNDNLETRDSIYKHLNLLFLQIFSDHNLTPDDIFDKNVWFLKRSSNFQKLNSENISILEEPYNEFIKLLVNISLNGKNFSNMKINVKMFINEVCKELILANNIKNNSLEKIKIFNIEEMKEKITYKLSTERKNSTLMSNISQFKFSIRQLKNFTEGNYSFELTCDAFDDNGDEDRINFTKYSTKLNNQSFIIVNEKNKDGTLLNNEYFLTISLKNEKNYDSLYLNECYLSRSKFNQEDCYSGILIYSFKFIVKKDNFSFAISDNINFFDLFLKNLDILIYDKPLNFSSSTFALSIKDEKDKKLIIEYDLEIDLDKKIKILILEKIYNIFQDIIISSYENNKLINNYLEYFIEYREEIRALLNEKNNDNNSCSCDSGCVIF
jgi:hypothetical protein